MPHKIDYRNKKRAETLYENLKVSMFGVMLTSLFSALALYSNQKEMDVLLWLSLMWALCIVRVYSIWRFKRTEIDAQGYVKWIRMSVLGAFLTGIGSGYLCFHFFDLGAVNSSYDISSDYVLVFNSILVLLVYLGFVAGNVACNYCHLPTYFAGTAVATILVLVGLFTSGGEAGIILAILVGIFFVVMFSFAKNLNNHFEDNVEWSYQRDELVAVLENKKKEAEEAVKAKSNFFASASHDLRQPLHALGLFQDALRKRIDDPGSVEIMDKISNSTHSLNELLHSMLDISKLEASTVKNNPVKFNLRSSMENLRVEYEERSEEKGLDFIFKVPTNIDFYLDTVLFNRVVRNIVDNAIKYTKEGSVSIVVRKSAKKDRWVMTISDTGQGIPADKQAEVFSEFSQLDNPERNRQKGLGLGLSIVDRLCTLMGIEIQLDSVFAKGTIIALILPEEVRGSSLLADDEKDATKEETSLTVLLVDDDNNILDGTSVLLKAEGWKVITAKSGAEALVVSRGKNIDCIVSDYILGDSMNGIELITELRDKADYNIPGILLTGYAKPNLLVEAGDAGLTILTKPTMGDDLLLAINEVVH